MTDGLRIAGALLTVVVGAVHLQQYADFIARVPTIGESFLLNAAGAGVVVLMLAVPRLHGPGALLGIAVSAGALVALALSALPDGLFDYRETTLRGAVLVAITAEAGAVLTLAGYLLLRRRAAADDGVAA